MESQTQQLGAISSGNDGDTIPISSTPNGGPVPIVAVAMNTVTEILRMSPLRFHLSGGRELSVRKLLSTVGGRGPITFGGLKKA
jgi:hypothetical protein